MTEYQTGSNNSENWHPQESKPESEKPVVAGFFDRIVGSNSLQPEGRTSTVKLYGGELKQEDGKTVFDMRGLVSSFDRFGDEIVRAGDDHTVKNPEKMLARHPKAFLKTLISKGKRFKVFDKEKLDEHYKKFGLHEYYAGHENGIEIKKPEILTKGYSLQDIYRMPELGIDRLAAVGEAASYLRQLHDKANEGLGEGVIYNFMFQHRQADKVSEPVIFIPSVMYDSEKETSVIDQKATDLMELVTSAGMEEFKQSHNWEEAKKTILAVLDNYRIDADDTSEKPSVISMVSSFIKRGRLNLAGEKIKTGFSKVGVLVKTVGSWHNSAHMQVPAEDSEHLRQVLTQTLDEFLNNHKANVRSSQ